MSAKNLCEFVAQPSCKVRAGPRGSVPSFHFPLSQLVAGASRRSASPGIQFVGGLAQVSAQVVASALWPGESNPNLGAGCALPAQVEAAVRGSPESGSSGWPGCARRLRWRHQLPRQVRFVVRHRPSPNQLQGLPAASTPSH